MNLVEEGSALVLYSDTATKLTVSFFAKIRKCDICNKTKVVHYFLLKQESKCENLALSVLQKIQAENFFRIGIPGFYWIFA